MIRRTFMMAAIVLWSVTGCGRESTETPAPDTTVTETQASFDTLVTLTNSHIREGNFEAAETSLREMEQLGPQLTDVMRQQIQTMRAALTAARAGGSPGDPAATTPPPAPAAQ